MTAWERAVEAMTTLWPKGNPSQIEATALLAAALPHLRRMMAEELRAEAKRCDPTNAYPRGPGRWLDAADHVEVK